MRKHHAVFGTPISPSLSPRIHAAFARQCGIELDYLAIEADAGDFRAKLDDFAAHGGTGANVTGTRTGGSPTAPSAIAGRPIVRD